MSAFSPLQMVISEAVAEGSGFTVTTSVTDSPAQLPTVGVTVYVTVPDTLPLFCGVSVIGPLPLAETVAETIGPVMALVHAKVVEPIVAVGTKFNASVLHICCDKLAALFVITGVGVTVTTTSKVGPAHPLAIGVMV